jgi:hypothetical protein
MASSPYIILDQYPADPHVCAPGFSVKLPDGELPWSTLQRASDMALAKHGIYRVAAPPEKPFHRLHSVNFKRSQSLPVTFEAEGIYEQDSIASVQAALLNEVETVREGLLYGGYRFQGVRFQSRPADWINITSIGVEACISVTAGAKVGDLRWRNKSADFAWISENNSFVFMDAQTMKAFYKLGSDYTTEIIFRSRHLKNQIASTRVFSDLIAIDVRAGWPNTDAD